MADKKETKDPKAAERAKALEEKKRLETARKDAPEGRPPGVRTK